MQDQIILQMNLHIPLVFMHAEKFFSSSEFNMLVYGKLLYKENWNKIFSPSQTAVIC